MMAHSMHRINDFAYLMKYFFLMRPTLGDHHLLGVSITLNIQQRQGY